MKNRKLPFGYELRMGKVCIKESEAEVVRLIFRSYQEGASYNQIAGFLGSQPIPYREEGQPWNKNMWPASSRMRGTPGWTISHG